MPTGTKLSAIRLLQILTLLLVASVMAMAAVAQSKSSPESPAPSAADTAAINRFVSAQEVEVGGEEVQGARKIAVGDLNHDGLADVAVLYTLQSTSGSKNIQYLAAFVRLEGRLVHMSHIIVGGKDYKTAQLETIKNNVIYLSTLGYGATDPMCCPSKKGSARFVLADNKLVSQ